MIKYIMAQIRGIKKDLDATKTDCRESFSTAARKYHEIATDHSHLHTSSNPDPYYAQRTALRTRCYF